MDAPLRVLKNNLHLWNLKVLKLKQQQEITKNYLETNIKNLQITNETLQKLENFMAESHSNPNFMSNIMDQLRKEQEHSNSSTYVGGLGFQCVDKFLLEYTNENFQRDKKHKLKNMTSKRKILELKKKLQREMEEEVKRLGFFQNELKLDISNMKKKEQIAKWDLWLVKRCLENANRMIEHFVSKLLALTLISKHEIYYKFCLK
ncbi:hypothetical protein L1887_03788 [Cichorium endivia]|nr:hypothetical protein L1887_03788 [Cichorium endivia]